MPHLIKSKCMQTLFNLFHKKHISCIICWNQNDQQLLRGICNYTEIAFHYKMHDYCKAHDCLHLEMNDSHVTKYIVTSDFVSV